MGEVRTFTVEYEVASNDIIIGKTLKKELEKTLITTIEKQVGHKYTDYKVIFLQKQTGVQQVVTMKLFLKGAQTLKNVRTDSEKWANEVSEVPGVSVTRVDAKEDVRPATGSTADTTADGAANTEV